MQPCILLIFLIHRTQHPLTQQLRSPAALPCSLSISPSPIAVTQNTGAPQALVLKPLALLRPLGLLVFSIRFPLAATHRARRRLWAQQAMPFGGLLPDHSLVLLLALTFAVVNPVVLPAAALYFG